MYMASLACLLIRRMTIHICSQLQLTGIKHFKINLIFFLVISCIVGVSIYTFLGISGWKISDGSIRTGLEHTRLLGRSQFLTSSEAEALGLPGTTILLNGGLMHMSSFLAVLHYKLNLCLMSVNKVSDPMKYTGTCVIWVLLKRVRYWNGWGTSLKNIFL